MVEFVTIPDEKESVAQWSSVRSEVDSVYKEIWGDIEKLPDGDNGNSRQS